MLQRCWLLLLASSCVLEAAPDNTNHPLPPGNSNGCPRLIGDAFYARTFLLDCSMLPTAHKWTEFQTGAIYIDIPSGQPIIVLTNLPVPFSTNDLLYEKSVPGPSGKWNVKAYRATVHGLLVPMQGDAPQNPKHPSRCELVAACTNGPSPLWVWCGMDFSDAAVAVPRFIAFLKSASNPVAPYTKNDPRTYTKDEVTHITDLLRSGSCGLACGAELLETLDRNFDKKDILAFMPQMERLINLNSKKNKYSNGQWQCILAAYLFGCVEHQIFNGREARDSALAAAHSLNLSAIFAARNPFPEPAVLWPPQ
jgi:hypothetical protein